MNAVLNLLGIATLYALIGGLLSVGSMSFMEGVCAGIAATIVIWLAVEVTQ